MDISDCDSVIELHHYFSEILEAKKCKKCKANEVRTFVETYHKQVKDHRIPVDVLHKVFSSMRTDIAVDKSYFTDIVTKAWYSFEEDDTLYIDANVLLINKKAIRRRRF